MKETEKAKNKRNSQREILDKLIDRPIRFLVQHDGITPNVLSLLGFLCSLAVAILIAFGGLHFPIWIAWIIPVLFFLSGSFDVLDGELARRQKIDSKAGAFLDSNLDRLSDTLIIISLILGGYLHYILGFIMVFLVIMISYIRARSESEGIDMRGVGFMERAERLIVLLCAFVIEFYIYFLTKIFTGTPFTLFFPLIFAPIFLGLLLLTVIQRLVFAFKALRELDTQNIENTEK